jgi:hypothetical protein
MLLPALARSKTKTHLTIDLGNTSQILQAVHLYSADNTDFLPHPTWGTVPSGPTGWLYGAGMKDGALPLSATPAQINAAISNQLVYFRKGQLASYLNNNQQLFECPTDVAQRRSGNFKLWYLQRSVKLTAYTFTGAISGFGAPKQAPNASAGGTFKISQFHPTSFLMWEPDETRPFNFNDAAANQENSSEGVSLRHNRGSNGAISASGSRALLGQIDGHASFIDPKTFAQLRATASENDLRCGPGYR